MNIFFFLFIAYLLAPKIDIIGTTGAALRPEDIISLMAFAIYILSRKRYRLEVPLTVKLYLVFVAIGYVSALVNIGSVGLTGIVYNTRLVQYLLWFFVMYEACHTVSWRTFRLTLIAVSLIFVIWSGLELSGTIGRVGRFTGAEGRLTINTSGPFETSVMLAMLGYSLPSILLTPVMIVLVLLTQARITLLGMIVAAGAAKPIKALAAGLVAVVAFSFVAQPLLARLEKTRLSQSDSPARMAEVLAVSWSRAPVLDDPIDFRERFLSGPTIYRYMVSSKGDRSFGYRAVRWPIVIKTTMAYIGSALIGWSPGSWGVALDNYYIRAFGETGLIGLAAFLVWIAMSILRLRQGGIARFSLIMMAIVGTFIDIFTSSKVMPLLWVFFALEHARHPFAMPMRRLRLDNRDRAVPDQSVALSAAPPRFVSVAGT